MMLYVKGNPAPQGSKRYLGKTKEGKAIIAETSNKTTPWRADIMGACERYQQAHPEELFPLTGGLMARMVFHFQRPKSSPRRRRPHMTVPPDLDKLARGVLDPLQIQGIIGNDSMLVSLNLEKLYVGDPGASMPVPGLFLVIMTVEEDLELGAQ